LALLSGLDRLTPRISKISEAPETPVTFLAPFLAIGMPQAEAMSAAGEEAFTVFIASEPVPTISQTTPVTLALNFSVSNRSNASQAPDNSSVVGPRVICAIKKAPCCSSGCLFKITCRYASQDSSRVIILPEAILQIKRPNSLSFSSVTKGITITFLSLQHTLGIDQAKFQEAQKGHLQV